MNLIVAVAQDWGIGKNNDLLFHIPKDKAFFKGKTINQVVVMGRKTFESLPGKSPLKDRVNIVLTNNESYKADDIVVCSSINALKEELTKYDDKEIYVIGGESIYEYFLPYCEKAFVTKIHGKKDADCFFPNLDNLDNWEKAESMPVINSEDIDIGFYTYANKQVMSF